MTKDDYPRMMCPDCYGNGIVKKARMLVSDGISDTALIPENCDTCDGEGWLPFPGQLRSSGGQPLPS